MQTGIWPGVEPHQHALLAEAMSATNIFGGAHKHNSWRVPVDGLPTDRTVSVITRRIRTLAKLKANRHGVAIDGHGSDVGFGAVE